MPFFFLSLHFSYSKILCICNFNTWNEFNQQSKGEKNYAQKNGANIRDKSKIISISNGFYDFPLLSNCFKLKFEKKLKKKRFPLVKL